jgi:hypothetical protein
MRSLQTGLIGTSRMLSWTYEILQTVRFPRHSAGALGLYQLFSGWPHDDPGNEERSPTSRGACAGTYVAMRRRWYIPSI